MTTQEIAEYLSAELVGSPTVNVNGIASLDSASDSEIAFTLDTSAAVKSQAACVLVPQDFSGDSSQPYLRVRNPKLAFTRIARKLKKYDQRYSGAQYLILHPTADVRTTAIGSFVTIGKNSSIGEGCELGDGVRIGNNVTIKKHTTIHQNCVIYDDVEIGNGCVLHAGTVIGTDGFGYVKNETGEHQQFPQVGSVVIGDNVEIGANCTIDRGSLGVTRIGNGSKFDNMVHIAHNVQIGKRVLIAAQTGIAGSCIIGDDVVLGGQVGVGDHVTIESGTVIGSKSGIFPHKIVRPGFWSGIPIQPNKEYLKEIANLRSIGKIKTDVEELNEVIARKTG